MGEALEQVLLGLVHHFSNNSYTCTEFFMINLFACLHVMTLGVYLISEVSLPDHTHFNQSKLFTEGLPWLPLSSLFVRYVLCDMSVLAGSW